MSSAQLSWSLHLGCVSAGCKQVLAVYAECGTWNCKVSIMVMAYAHVPPVLVHCISNLFFSTPILFTVGLP